MPLWLQISLPIVLSIVSSIATYFTAVHKSKGEIKTLRVQHEQRFEEQKREHAHQIEKMKLEYELEIKKQRDCKNIDLGNNMASALMGNLFTPEGIMGLGKMIDELPMLKEKLDKFNNN